MSLQLVIPFLPVIALPKNKVGHNDGLSKKWVLFEMTAKLVYLSTGSCQLPYVSLESWLVKPPLIGAW